MGKISGWTAAILIVLAIVISGILSYSLFPHEITKTETVIKTVEVPKDVIVTKEVTVPLDASATYLQPAIDEFLSSDEFEDMTICNGEEYDEEQIAIKAIKDWSVLFDDSDYTVNAEIKLKYLDKDVEEKCYSTLDIEVFYEEDEDPVISVI